MSLLKIQNHEGDDLVTIDLNTGKVEILSKQELGDAAYAFWDAINTTFGRSTQEDIVIQGGKEKELNTDFLDNGNDLKGEKDYYKKVAKVIEDHEIAKGKESFKKAIHKQRVKEYVTQMPSHNLDVATAADPDIDIVKVSDQVANWKVSMGYSDEEYDPDVKVEDWWDPAPFDFDGMPKGRIDHIEGNDDLAYVLSQGNKTNSNLDSFNVDKLREQVDYALANPDYSGETLSLSKAYDNKLTIDVDGPGDIVFQAAKKPSP